MMNEEKENLLTHLNELIKEAHAKGYSFILDHWNEETRDIITLYLASDDPNIDIVEWN
jgi:hypothetical protein